MEDVVDLPIPRQREADSEWGDDFLNLEGTMILVVQLPQGAAGFNIPSAEHHQVSYLVCRGFLTVRVGVLAHSLLCGFQPLAGLVMHGVHPMRIDCAGRVERSSGSRVHGNRVESVVGVERGHPVADGDRIVVTKLGHW